MKIKTDLPCECGSYKFEAHEEDRGYMGSQPVYETVAVCEECGITIYQTQLSKLFNESELTED